MLASYFFTSVYARVFKHPVKMKNKISLYVHVSLVFLAIAVSPNARAIPMTAPTSGFVEILNGTDFYPTMNGGAGGASNAFVVVGYTGWTAYPWTPPGPGTYTFYVARINPYIGYTGNIIDPEIGELACDGTSYTLYIGVPAPMICPIGVNSGGPSFGHWMIDESSGFGGSTYVYSIEGLNWRSDSISAKSFGFISGRTYTFYVALVADSQHQGNAVDPLLGSICVNYTPYTYYVTYN